MTPMLAREERLSSRPYQAYVTDMPTQATSVELNRLRSSASQGTNASEGSSLDQHGQQRPKRRKLNESQFEPVPAPWSDSALPALTPAMVKLSQLAQPDNFGIIKVNQIYRSSYPLDHHLPFLEGLNLRTIVVLVDEPRSQEYLRLMQRKSIKHVVCIVTPNKDKLTGRSRTEVKQVWSVLDYMMDERNHPMLIHCNAGKHRSGCVTASYRKCTGAKMDDILNEYMDYAGLKARELDLRFIRAFDESEYLWSKTLKGQVTGPAPLDVEQAMVGSPLSPKHLRVTRASV